MTTCKFIVAALLTIAASPMASAQAPLRVDGTEFVLTNSGRPRPA